jgi:nicotinamidase-related amidase
MSVVADPYPWPYDGLLDPIRLALVIAGDQPAWASRSWGADSAGAVIARVADAVRSLGGLIVRLRHFAAAPRGPLPPLAHGVAGEVLGPVDPADRIVDAAGVDGFFGSPLDRTLRAAGCDRLVFAGYGGEAAVSSTLRSANDRGYECLTLADAVAPFDAATGRHNLSSITMSGGIFGAVGSSDALLAALRPLAAPIPAEVP